MPAHTARALAAVLTGGLAASLLAGCYVDVGTPRSRTKSYAATGQVRTLVVHAHVGSVHITGGAAGVSVTEHLTYRHTAPVTTHRSAAGTLTLDSQCPALETCSVGYDIKVPSATTIQISDNVGAISLKSLSGQVTAHTNAGNIELDTVSGPVVATGHAGSVTGTGVSSPSATLGSSVGGIEVTFSAAPASVTATTSVGSVRLHLPGGVAYAVTASSSTGTAHVGVHRQASSRHVITASTKTGTVTIDPTG
jgi:putative adhesin